MLKPSVNSFLFLGIVLSFLFRGTPAAAGGFGASADAPAVRITSNNIPIEVEYVGSDGTVYHQTTRYLTEVHGRPGEYKLGYQNSSGDTVERTSVASGSIELNSVQANYLIQSSKQGKARIQVRIRKPTPVMALPSAQFNRLSPEEQTQHRRDIEESNREGLELLGVYHEGTWVHPSHAYLHYLDKRRSSSPAAALCNSRFGSLMRP